jgi:hypothetical protein
MRHAVPHPITNYKRGRFGPAAGHGSPKTNRLYDILPEMALLLIRALFRKSLFFFFFLLYNIQISIYYII